MSRLGEVDFVDVFATRAVLLYDLILARGELLEEVLDFLGVGRVFLDAEVVATATASATMAFADVEGLNLFEGDVRSNAGHSRYWYEGRLGNWLAIVKTYLLALDDLGEGQFLGNVSQNLRMRVVVPANLEVTGLAGVDGETLATGHVERPMILVTGEAVVAIVLELDFGFTKVSDKLWERHIIKETGAAGSVRLGFVEAVEAVVE